MSETKTVETEYGTAEIEIVECDSCGNTVGKEQAKRFAIGEKVPNPRINDAEVNGWACEYCMAEGPLSFPQQVSEWALPKEEQDDYTYGITFHIILAVVVIPFETINGFQSDSGKFTKGYAIASVTYLLYIFLGIGLWWLL